MMITLLLLWAHGFGVEQETGWIVIAGTDSHPTLIRETDLGQNSGRFLQFSGFTEAEKRASSGDYYSNFFDVRAHCLERTLTTLAVESYVQPEHVFVGRLGGGSNQRLVVNGTIGETQLDWLCEDANSRRFVSISEASAIRLGAIWQDPNIHGSEWLLVDQAPEVVTFARTDSFANGVGWFLRLNRADQEHRTQRELNMPQIIVGRFTLEAADCEARFLGVYREDRFEGEPEFISRNFLGAEQRISVSEGSRGATDLQILCDNEIPTVGPIVSTAGALRLAQLILSSADE